MLATTQDERTALQGTQRKRDNRRLAEPPKVDHCSPSDGELPRSNQNDFPMGILFVLVGKSQGCTKVWI